MKMFERKRGTQCMFWVDCQCHPYRMGSMCERCCEQELLVSSVPPGGLQDLCDRRTLYLDMAWFTVATSIDGVRRSRGQGAQKVVEGNSADSGVRCLCSTVPSQTPWQMKDTACVSTFFDFSVLWYFLNRMILLSLYSGKITFFRYFCRFWIKTQS